jgi:molybdate transport system permease protein
LRLGSPSALPFANMSGDPEQEYFADGMVEEIITALSRSVMGFPLMVRAIRLSIEAVDRRLENAASALGAGRVWVFLLITLPLTLPGIIAGLILSFARSMGEFGAKITFVSNIPGETQTLPSAIYTLTQVPSGDAGALRLTLVSIAISMLALLAAEVLARRLSRILPET